MFLITIQLNFILFPAKEPRKKRVRFAETPDIVYIKKIPSLHQASKPFSQANDSWPKNRPLEQDNSQLPSPLSAEMAPLSEPVLSEKGHASLPVLPLFADKETLKPKRDALPGRVPREPDQEGYVPEYLLDERNDLQQSLTSPPPLNTNRTSTGLPKHNFDLPPKPTSRLTIPSPPIPFPPSQPVPNYAAQPHHSTEIYSKPLPDKTLGVSSHASHWQTPGPADRALSSNNICAVSPTIQSTDKTIKKSVPSADYENLLKETVATASVFSAVNALIEVRKARINELLSGRASTSSTTPTPFRSVSPMPSSELMEFDDTSSSTQDTEPKLLSPSLGPPPLTPKLPLCSALNTFLTTIFLDQVQATVQSICIYLPSVDTESLKLESCSVTDAPQVCEPKAPAVRTTVSSHSVTSSSSGDMVLCTPPSGSPRLLIDLPSSPSPPPMDSSNLFEQAYKLVSEEAAKGRIPGINIERPLPTHTLAFVQPVFTNNESMCVHSSDESSVRSLDTFMEKPAGAFDLFNIKHNEPQRESNPTSDRAPEHIKIEIPSNPPTEAVTRFLKALPTQKAFPRKLVLSTSSSDENLRSLSSGFKKSLPKSLVCLAAPTKETPAGSSLSAADVRSLPDLPVNRHADEDDGGMPSSTSVDVDDLLEASLPKEVKLPSKKKKKLCPEKIKFLVQSKQTPRILEPSPLAMVENDAAECEEELVSSVDVASIPLPENSLEVLDKDQKKENELPQKECATEVQTTGSVKKLEDNEPIQLSSDTESEREGRRSYSLSYSQRRCEKRPELSRQPSDLSASDPRPSPRWSLDEIHYDSTASISPNVTATTVRSAEDETQASHLEGSAQPSRKRSRTTDDDKNLSDQSPHEKVQKSDPIVSSDTMQEPEPVPTAKVNSGHSTPDLEETTNPSVSLSTLKTRLVIKSHHFCAMTCG